MCDGGLSMRRERKQEEVDSIAQPTLVLSFVDSRLRICVRHTFSGRDRDVQRFQNILDWIDDCRTLGSGKEQTDHEILLIQNR